MSKPKRNPWQQEYDMACKILANEGGKLEWASDNHVAFRYIEDGLRIAFYPHKTSAGNQHIRVRLEGGKITIRAVRLFTMLDHGSGFNCTFSVKNQGGEMSRRTLAYQTETGLEFGWAARKAGVL